MEMVQELNTATEGIRSILHMVDSVNVQLRSQLDRRSIDLATIPQLEEALFQLHKAATALNLVVKKSIDIQPRLRAEERRRHLEQLPVELFQRVIAMSIPFYFDPVRLPAIRFAKQTALRFSHVSRRWRSVVISDPTLWNRMEISSETSEDMIKLFLLRSHETPLHIYINWGAGSFDYHSSRLRDYAALLLTHVDRWFRLRITGIHITESVWSQPTGPWPAELTIPKLQQLELCCTRYPYGEPWSAFQCPMLRTFVCEDSPVIQLPSTRGLTSGALLADSHASLAFIGRNTYLETLEINFKCWFANNDVLVHLPRLRSLNIILEFNHLPDVMAFSSQLRSTSLQNLTLNVAVYTDGQIHEIQFTEPLPAFPSLVALLLRVQASHTDLHQHFFPVLERFTSSYPAVTQIELGTDRSWEEIDSSEVFSLVGLRKFSCRLERPWHEIRMVCEIAEGGVLYKCALIVPPAKKAGSYLWDLRKEMQRQVKVPVEVLFRDLEI